ncbi:putative gustatory receptor 28b [Cephus cinctus]|uniref:Gustatory receptor n=1 Tax=Cephus cinctus TaxID=211228 RepID=A0AAJ7BNY3_CEPCN|nr:putative gustatory receptor 28b [Cephus cinctus]
MDKTDFLSIVKTNNIGRRIYSLFSHLNIGVVLFIDILSWTRTKDLDVYFVRMNAVIKVMERLGIKDNHWRHLRFQYIQYCILCFNILISSACTVWFMSGITMTIKLSLSYGYFYPIIIIHVSDIYFVIFIRYIGTKFEQLNETLSDRLKTLSKIDDTEEHIQPEENLCNFIKSIRQIHLELIRLSKYLNKVFDVQLLISITISVVFIISWLMNTYNILIGTTFDSQTYLRTAGLIDILTFYCFKIFIIGQTCGATSAAAQKTGGIVFKFYNFERSKEIRGEIEKFTMQLIQNPASFTAHDFLTLDNAFVFRVAASITTYLIILIQMNNSMFDVGQVNTTIPIQ